MTKQTTLARTASIATAATWSFIGLQLAFSAFLVWQTAVYRAYFANTNGADEIAAAVRMDALNQPVALSFIGLIVLVYVINGRWLFLAAKTAAATAPSNDRISAGWAVGWYAVPIANFFKPYQSMKEIWRDTVGKGAMSEGAFPSWFGLWWGSWVVLNIWDRVSDRALNSVPFGGDDYFNWTLAIAFSGAAWIIPSMFFLRIIKDVTASTYSQAEIFS